MNASTASAITIFHTELSNFQIPATVARRWLKVVCLLDLQYGEHPRAATCLSRRGWDYIEYFLSNIYTDMDCTYRAVQHSS